MELPSIGKKCMPSWWLPICMACSAPVPSGRHSGMSPRRGSPRRVTTRARYPGGTDMPSLTPTATGEKPSNGFSGAAKAVPGRLKTAPNTLVTAAAKQIMDQGKPLRTIRILWAGAEEVGLWGGKAYAKAHTGSNHAIAMESDFGADKVWRVQFHLPEQAKAVKEQIAQALLPLGIGANGPRASGGADVSDIIDSNNLAIIDLQQDGTRYFDLHHTPDDTLDKIDPKQVQQNVAAWSTVLSIIANSDVDFTMPPKE